MKSCLLVIDAQHIYSDRESELYCQDVEKTLDNINSVIHSFKTKDDLIIYIRHMHQPDGSDLGRMFDFDGEEDDNFDFKADTPEVGYMPGLVLAETRHEIIKNRYSAFVKTSLDSLLKEKGITHLVITGFMTHFCCESTARDAHDRDYFVSFLLDATGTPGTEKWNQKEVRGIVGNFLSEGFARVYSTQKYLALQ